MIIATIVDIVEFYYIGVSALIAYVIIYSLMIGSFWDVVDYLFHPLRFIAAVYLLVSWFIIYSIT